MKTKKRESSPSRFTRGERVSAKSARRHGRKTGGESHPKEDIAPKPGDASPAL